MLLVYRWYHFKKDTKLWVIMSCLELKSILLAARHLQLTHACEPCVHSVHTLCQSAARVIRRDVASSLVMASFAVFCEDLFGGEQV